MMHTARSFERDHCADAALRAQSFAIAGDEVTWSIAQTILREVEGLETIPPPTLRGELFQHVPAEVRFDYLAPLLLRPPGFRVQVLGDRF